MSRTTAHLHGAQTDDTPVHQALREAPANCLVHADYFGQQGVVITKSPRLLTFSNSGGFRIMLTLHLEKIGEIADFLGLGSSRTRDYLQELAEAGVVIADGSDKSHVYRLKY